MKIANIVLSVLILLFAAASAVFSYFLFEKRSQFVDGWAKMAVAINKSAVALDLNSGTKKLAEELTPATLAHENYADLNNRLPKLEERARQVVQSRDTLAKSLHTIAKSVEAKKVPSKEALCGLNTYDASQNAVVSAIADTIRNRDTQYNKVINLSRNYLKANIDRQALKDGRSNAFDNMEKALKVDKDRRSKYELALSSIAGKVGRDRLDTGKYANSVNVIVNNVEKLRVLQQKTAGDLRTTQNKLRTTEKNLKASDNKVKNLTAVVKNRDNEIKVLKKALGLAPDAKVTIWADGSNEARKLLSGNVLKVDNEFGYISIDLGSNTRVIQKIGNREQKINPLIVSGLELVVVDGSLEDKAKFVSRVKVKEVGENCATADIPAGSKEIKPGYKVYWLPAN